MQTLERYSVKKENYRLDPVNLVETDAIWLLAYDIRYLETIYRHKNNAALPARVRKKYETTWRLLMHRHRGFMSTLEESGFDPTAISACDWTEPFARIGTRRGFFG